MKRIEIVDPTALSGEKFCARYGLTRDDIEARKDAGVKYLYYPDHLPDPQDIILEEPDVSLREWVRQNKVAYRLLLDKAETASLSNAEAQQFLYLQGMADRALFISELSD